MKKKGLIGAIVTAIVVIAVVVGVIMCIERFRLDMRLLCTTSTVVCPAKLSEQAGT